MFLSEKYPYHGVGRWVDKTAGIFWRSDKRDTSYICRKQFDTFIDSYSLVGKFITVWGYKTSTDEQKNLTEPYAGFYVDIDCEDIEEAHAATKKIYYFFRDIYKLSQTQVKVVFSGNKGFHIECCPVALGIKKGRPDLPHFYRWFAKKLQNRLSLPSGIVDFKVYEPKRQWRCVRTIHETSKLWCHTLPEKVFDDLNASLMFCTTDQDYSRWSKVTILNPMASSMFESEYVSFKSASRRIAEQPNIRKQNIDPNRLPSCIVSCLSRTIPQGDRNLTIYTVARALYSIYGIDQNEIQHLLLNWMPEISDSEKYNTIKSAVQSDTPFSCMSTSVMGDLIARGIVDCPYKTDVERRAFCDVYAGKPLSGYKNIGKHEVSEYLEQLYAALETNRIKGEWTAARKIMSLILQYEEKWLKEWERSVK